MGKENTCPDCETKEDKKKIKKPFYKRVWFWCLCLLVLVLFYPSKSSQGNTVSQGGTSGTKSQVKNEETQPDEKDTPAPSNQNTAPISESITAGQKNALSSAQSYLNFSAFSHDGLIDQLEYEKYSTEDATWAADNCGANWNDQALKSAKNYLQYSAFSYSGLIEQLEYEKYTSEQATYGADNCGADWNEQAVKCAENYLNYSSFSRQGLIDQLVHDGFTAEQADYGVTQNGL